jgi:hypothetical protein
MCLKYKIVTSNRHKIMYTVQLVIPSMNRRMPPDAMRLLPSNKHRSYLRIMWPIGNCCWRQPTQLRDITNIHICILHKSPEYHWRIPAVCNCSCPQHTLHMRELSVIQILIQNTILHMTGLGLLYTVWVITYLHIGNTY